MSIRPKDRFEAFKRDGFTCQYCGRKAPDVVLEADHIIPRAEGGGDELENLLTACWDCNHGKGARLLDDRAPAPHIAEQTALIKEREAQLRAYTAAKQAERETRDLVYNRVRNHWFDVWKEESLDRWHLPWENNLRFAIDKLGEEEVKDAMDITARKFRYVTSNAVRYFGGVIKTKVADIEGRITACTICGERMVLSRDEAREGIDGWYHVACKSETPEA